jgi:hypothetical protein
MDLAYLFCCRGLINYVFFYSRLSCCKVGVGEALFGGVAKRSVGCATH